MYLLTACRFSVRDFVYDEASIQAGKKEAEDADTKKKKQFVSDACVVIAYTARAAQWSKGHQLLAIRLGYGYKNICSDSTRLSATLRRQVPWAVDDFCPLCKREKAAHVFGPLLMQWVCGMLLLLGFVCRCCCFEGGVLWNKMMVSRYLMSWKKQKTLPKLEICDLDGGRARPLGSCFCERKTRYEFALQHKVAISCLLSIAFL